jgi:predicted AAA+ superfamily ATPase
MGIDSIQQILIDQRASFNQHEDLIERDVDIQPYLKTGQIVIISGVRRCGKSSLLFLMKEAMGLADPQYCYFNFDDERIPLETSLPELVYRQHVQLFGEEPVFFFDEIQNIPGWEKFVNRMHEEGHKLFITGSNAALLSSEIATALTGRNKVLPLYPFSFSEYLRFLGHDPYHERLTTKEQALRMHACANYLQYGGFPLLVKEEDIELLDDYFRDILYRDIIARYGLTRTNEIRQMALYLASNVGKRFSYRTLQSVSGLKSTNSVKDYLSYFGQSYLFFYVNKFAYSLKKQLAHPKKVYAIDPAFANRLGFRFTEDKGRLLENVIYLELLRRKKEVFFHAEADQECDFITRQGLDIQQAIQVTWTLNAQNRHRELKGLKGAMEQYGLTQGTLITWETLPIQLSDLPEGIQHIPAWKWLLDKATYLNLDNDMD